MVNRHDYSDAPQLLKDFVVYLQLVKNRSELTVLNYYSDLRTFFRFYKLRAGRVSDDKSFSDINIADISVSLTPEKSCVRFNISIYFSIKSSFVVKTTDLF